MAKRILVVGTIQGYFIEDDTEEDVDDLIQRDLADSIQCSPSEYIIFDAPPAIVEKLLNKEPLTPDEFESCIVNHMSLCTSCIESGVIDAVSMAD
jgi:hypothetical protein